MNKYGIIIFLSVIYVSLLNAGDHSQEANAEKDARHSVKNYICNYVSILDFLPKNSVDQGEAFKNLEQTANNFIKSGLAEKLSIEEIEKFESDYYKKLMDSLASLEESEDANEVKLWASECHDQIKIQLEIIRGHNEEESYVDLKQYMNHLHAHYVPQFKTQNTILKLEPFDQDMSIRILVEESELHAALTNLLTNSLSMQLEASKQDDRETSACLGVTVSNAADPGKKYLCFSVKDSGPGFSPTSKRKAFKRDFTERQNTKGTGQGLSQVKSFAKKHGGEASVDNVLDESGQVKGAVVTLSIVVKYQG